MQGLPCTISGKFDVIQAVVVGARLASCWAAAAIIATGCGVADIGTAAGSCACRQIVSGLTVHFQR